MIVLICTLGKEDSMVYPALRIHRYNQLILVMEKDAINNPAHTIILELEKGNINPPKAIQLDSMDFFESYKTLEKLIIDQQKRKNEITLHIILSMAAILCAFNYGVPAHHYEANHHTKLPVFHGVSIKTRISDAQLQIIHAIKDGMSLESLLHKMHDSDLSPEKIKRELRLLKDKRLIITQLKDNDIQFFLSENANKFKPIL